MIFIDANTYVYASIECAEHEESTAAVIGPAATDALVLLETHRAIMKITKNREYANTVIRRIIAKHTIYPVTPDSVLMALKHPALELADAIHYVLAEGNEIVTWDKQLKAYARTHRKQT